ncbi:MAG: DUF2961 domain-containing protein [Pirellulales bacterium]|nr:DUF2961 domain-containing protein [Pirellulales bacterium]
MHYIDNRVESTDVYKTSLSCQANIEGTPRTTWLGLILLGVLFLVGSVEALAEDATRPNKLFVHELSDLHLLWDYRTHKNSFVLGQETISGLPQMVIASKRKTILAVEGQGSLRHIWETHDRVKGKKGPAFVLEFYVDGEKEPSLRGRLDHLIAAAVKCQQPFVTVPGRVVPKESYNLYLPVPFEKSLRVELIPTGAARSIFLQLDYRTDDDSMAGIRLKQQGEGPDMRLFYEGLDNRASEKTTKPRATKHLESTFTGSTRLVVQGPAIIRRLAVETPRQGARLRIRFDGESTAAVDANLADFYGPFSGPVLGGGACRLPMPFRIKADIEITGMDPEKESRLIVDAEPVKRFDKPWGYFHAKSHKESDAKGWFPSPVLCTRGRGHWIGMSLYNTGHNHGGGDFALIDGRSARPLLLHGINGEDYFSFAWHAVGQNPPYSEAVSNEKGRVRFHLENPYVFHDSLEIAWSVLQGTSPRSVAYWYQNIPADLTSTGKLSFGRKWSVFGPVSVPTTKDGNTPDVSNPARLFTALPDPAALDAGKDAVAQYNVLGRHQGTYHGWAQQRAVGPHLNLTYIYRHVIHRGSRGYLGYEPRAMMAQTELTSPRAQTVVLQLSYDDPIEVRLNGKKIHSDMTLREGLTTQRIKAPLAPGKNRLLLRLVDTPNLNDCWAGVVLRILDAQDKELAL